MIKMTLVPIQGWSTYLHKPFYEMVLICPGDSIDNPYAIAHIDTFHDKDYRVFYEKLTSGKSVTVRLLPDTDEAGEGDEDRDARVVIMPKFGIKKIADTVLRLSWNNFGKITEEQAEDMGILHEWMVKLIKPK